MTEPAPQNNYKDTLNLPKTSFDMKANLTQREPKMVEQWAKENLYQKIRARPHPKGKWILHDGPPYANGDIHMGHLINKVLKDIVVKFRTMQGHDSPYVPGWDCHGLPIESAIQKELGPKFRELTKDEVRKRCADYAMKYVKLQGDSFQRLGIFGSFDNPYLTMDKRYEAGILEVLAELVQRDLVYRQKKPVHWCTNDRTALAEAELEYATRKDHSIYVAFEIDWMGTGSPERNRAEEFNQKIFSDKVADTIDPLNKLGMTDEQRQRWNSAMAQQELNPKSMPKFYLLIWTTTPWTLPANRAVAVHPKYEYAMVECVVRGQVSIFIIAKELVEKVMKSAGISDYGIQTTFTGIELAEGFQYRHPLDANRKQPVLLADYVTLEDGTGLVHTAPGHGKEDYATGQKYGIETYNPVLSDGRYDDTVPEFLRGKSIWDANPLIIEKLRELGTLFHHAEFSHEYPHCWRCKKPTIQRATEQWFIKASGNDAPQPQAQAQGSPPFSTARAHVHAPTSTGADPAHASPTALQDSSPLWQNAKRFVDQVRWIPTWGKNRIEGMLDTRPDWCISRQRSWGVPIPAFFDARGRCLLTEASARRCADYFREHGANAWYTDTPAQILGLANGGSVDGPAPLKTAGFAFISLESLGFPTDVEVATLEKGMDILDVWFESGASHHAVLECTHPELGYPANMYLEGSDQHRGWFQSSLLEASGYKSEPPFKEVLTHGFVVDDQGKKYSKSSGNYVPVEKLLTQHGADVLRLWVASVDYQNDIKFSANLLTQSSEAYRKIRNTIRYLLGNLYDFNPDVHWQSPQDHSIDKWMEIRLKMISMACLAAYEYYDFHEVFQALYEFCNVDISAIYAKSIKDRLYCELPNDPSFKNEASSKKRRASQTMCFRILTRVIELLAPILSFTTEEAWSTAHQLFPDGVKELSVHLHKWDLFQDWETDVPKNVFNEIRSLENRGLVLEAITLLRETIAGKDKQISEQSFPLGEHWRRLMPLIEKGNKQLDDLKKSVALGNPLDAEAVIIVPSTNDEVAKLITEYAPEIEDALGVGFHRIEHGEIWDIKINDTRNLYPSCARSWKRRPDVGSDKDYPDLSARDAQVVRNLRAKQQEG